MAKCRRQCSNYSILEISSMRRAQGQRSWQDSFLQQSSSWFERMGRFIIIQVEAPAGPGCISLPLCLRVIDLHIRAANENPRAANKTQAEEMRVIWGLSISFTNHITHGEICSIVTQLVPYSVKEIKWRCVDRRQDLAICRWPSSKVLSMRRRGERSRQRMSCANNKMEWTIRSFATAHTPAHDKRKRGHLVWGSSIPLLYTTLQVMWVNVMDLENFGGVWRSSGHPLYPQIENFLHCPQKHFAA